MSDFGIYLLLVNNSSQTLTITYEAIDGKNASGTGTLYPHGRTSVMHASDSFGPHGAEGVFTFTLNGVDERSNQMIVYADCPWTGSDNKFEIRKSSQFLNISGIRFANTTDGLDNSDENWGESHLPESGHPLAIRIVVEDARIRSNLSVMTYNTHLFEGSWADNVGGFLHDKPVVFDDEKRADEIANKVVARPPDILCLQEVWSNDMRLRLVDKLKNIYPYTYLVPDKGTDLGLIGYLPVGVVGFLPPFWMMGAALGIAGGSIVAGASGMANAFTLNGLIDQFTNSSGLLLFSRYPLSNLDFKIYADLEGDDKFAKKGICTCDVTIPVSLSRVHTFRLGLTHAPTHVPDAQKCIDFAAGQTFSDSDTDGILAGDFNIHQTAEGEYTELEENMSKYNAVDVIREFLPDINDSYTDYSENGLNKIFFNTTETEKKDRIDYIYFRPGDSKRYLHPVAADVIHNWDYVASNDTNLPLSDHYPVVAIFHVDVEK